MGRKVFSTVWHKHFARLSKFACTAANRGDYELFRKNVEEIYQMIDTIAKEAGFEQHFGTKEQAPDTPVAAEGEHAPEDQGHQDEDQEGPGTAERASGKGRGANRGKARTSGSR
jgi:hypothetical protein